MDATEDENLYGWGALGPTVFQRATDYRGVNAKLGNAERVSGRNTDFRSTRASAGCDQFQETETGPENRYDKNSGSAVPKQIHSRNDAFSLQLGISVNRNEMMTNTRNDILAVRNYAHRRDQRYQQSRDPRTTLNARPLASEPEVDERGLQATYKAVGALSDDTYYDPSRPGWRTLMTTPGFMAGFHEQFNQLKTKWSPYEPHNRPWSEQSSTAGSGSTTSTDMERRVCRRRQCIASLIGLSLLAISAVIVPIIVVFTAKHKVTSNSTVWEQLQMNATITSEQFTIELGNTSSEAFKTFSSVFCAAIESNSKNYSRPDEKILCKVDSITNGSIIVQFTIVIERSRDTSARTNEKLLVAIGLHNGSSGWIGTFFVDSMAVKDRKVINENESPIQKRIAFNGSCSESDQCATVLAICIRSKCACPKEGYHDNTNDVCLKSEF